jgi:hemerythrin-like metal-binding protein
MHPALPLGVPLMDADHATVEAMFARVAVTADDDLAGLLAEIEAEVAAHFGREEALMAARDAPVAHCHQSQHALLLGEFAQARRLEEATQIRRALASLAELVASHVASVDRMTAQFLGGTLPADMAAKLRLPADFC